MQRQEQIHYRSCPTLPFLGAICQKLEHQPTCGFSNQKPHALVETQSEQTPLTTQQQHLAHVSVQNQETARSWEQAHLSHAAALHHITQNAYYSNPLVRCSWHLHCGLSIFTVRHCCFLLLQSCEISELPNAIFQANYLPQITFFLISLR